MKKIYSILILVACLSINVFGQSYDKNYTRIQNAKRGVQEMSEFLGELDVLYGTKADKITYYDGLDRPIQVVNRQASRNGRDFISIIQYDEFGMQPISYLPFTTYQNTGNYLSNPVYQQSQFYKSIAKVAHSDFPFSKSVFENSPIGKIIKQGAPGYEWQIGSNGHPVTYRYRFNQVNEVRKWTKSNGEFISTEFWGENSLQVKISFDENYADDQQGLETRVFVDERGLTIMKKVIVHKAGTIEDFVTYYIYNKMDLLVCIIPPKAWQEMITTADYSTASMQEDLLFMYQYDNEQRLISKKIPGISDENKEVYIYDKFGRLVLSQDGVLRQENKWKFFKYNYRGQVIISGIFHDPTNISYAAMKSYLDSYVDNVVTFDNEYFVSIDVATPLGYSNVAFPPLDGNDEILEVRYYSNYEFDVNNEYNFNNYANELFLIPFYRIDGKLTAQKTKILNDQDEWITDVVFYDKKGRAIRSISKIDFEGDQYLMQVDQGFSFTGKVEKKMLHNSTVIDGVTENNRLLLGYTYDHTGRLNIINSQIDDQDKIEMFSLKYNELGQVIEKNIHKNNELSNWQSVDYKYNIRGWLSSINQSNLTNDNSIIQLDQELEPDETVYGIKYDEISLNPTFDPGDAETGGTVFYDLTESKRLLVCNIEDTTIKREIVLNEAAVYSFNEYKTDSAKYFRLKDLTGQQYNFLFKGMEFDSYQNQSYILDLLMGVLSDGLEDQGVKEEDIKNEVLDEMRSFAEHRIGILYFNEDANDLFGMDLLYTEGIGDLYSDKQFNGNISGIKWQCAGQDNQERAYGFTYTGKNWLQHAYYGEKLDNTFSKDRTKYSVYNIDYDKNGNITQLNRKGYYSEKRHQPFPDIDRLHYTYDGNKLIKVEDEITGNLSTNDFRDHGVHQAVEYEYDAMGRLVSDANKHITNIRYNYLNLPEKISFGDTAKIIYLYDAAGRKISKRTVHGLNDDIVEQTDYINGFIYQNKNLAIISMDEYRLSKRQDGSFRYEYHLKDHLGNVRCTFTDFDGDNQPDITQADHYYPFGMIIEDIGYRSTQENNFLYQGKERQPDAMDTDFDGTADKRFLWYDFSARYYDAQLGRWHVPDPANQHYSGYLAMGNNPIARIDPDGLRDNWVYYRMALRQRMREERWLGYNSFSFNHAEVMLRRDQILNDILPERQTTENNISHPPTETTNAAAASENDEKYENSDNGDGKASPLAKAVAGILRFSPFVGFNPNPFMGAEAIGVDAGATVSGSEADIGKIFILAGPDAGELVTMSEVVGGAGSDLGVGAEFTRLDYTGNPNDLTSTNLAGVRFKAYAGGGEGFSIGVAFSIASHSMGGFIVGTAVQVGFGFSVFGPVYGGYNYGEMKVYE